MSDDSGNEDKVAGVGPDVTSTSTIIDDALLRQRRENTVATTKSEQQVPTNAKWQPTSTTPLIPPQSGNRGSIRASSRKNRVYVFRDFLVKTYLNGTAHGAAANNSTATKNSDNDRANIGYLKTPGSDDNGKDEEDNGFAVLDVAGGKGDLSWLLANVDDIQSIVMDPRSRSKSSHLVKSVVWLQEHPEEAKQRAIPHLPTHQPLAALIPQITQAATARRRSRCQQSKKRSNMSIHTSNTSEKDDNHQNDNGGKLGEKEDGLQYVEPPYLQMKLDNDFVEAVRISLQQEQKLKLKSRDTSFMKGWSPPPHWQTFWETARKSQQQSDDNHGSTVTGELLGEDLFLPESERGNKQRKIQNIPSLVSSAVHNDGNDAHNQDASRAWQILSTLRLVIGFHPDQATEACVDLAQVLKVPVCIVPCCVFPSEFPNRMLHSRDQNLQDATSTTAGQNATSPAQATTLSTAAIASTPTAIRVRDYEQFLQYLQQRHPNLRKDVLDFHQTETSRNIVLYTLPEDVT